MAVINIDDAYILNETGEQVDKVTGLFTKDENTTNHEKVFAQLNIGTAGSNRNLLDNGWFTVNQRQITTPSSPISGYPSDRWYGTYSAVTSDGVTIPAQNALDIYQKLEPDLCAALVGKTVTVSTLEQDGTIASFTCVFPAYGSGEGSNYNMGNGIGCFVQNISGYQRVRFRISDQRTTPLALRAAKLELGSVSTLANDVPPNYAEELAKCQRYFVRLKSATTQDVAATLAIALAGSTTAARAVVPLPTTPNAKTAASYSLSYSGSIYLVDPNNSSSHAVSSIILGEVNENSVFLRLDASGLTVGSNYFVRVTSGAYIDLSADL